MSDEKPSRLLSLSGLQRICRAYGRVKCGSEMICWDYANECALPEKELMADRERWAASERARLAMRTGEPVKAVIGSDPSLRSGGSGSA